jgi:RNA polymerase sigma-70 factor (ECF subfamily)
MVTAWNETAEAESRLIAHARAGDDAAFGELVRRSMRRAYAVALGLVGSPDDALDLSQEAFVRAYRAREKLDPERPFYAWIHTILRRLCFNFNRDRRTRREKIASAGPWLAEEAAARGRADDPDRVLERKELRRKLTAAIEDLPGREREVLVLKEFEGLRYREIAELLDIPIGTVTSRLYSARQRLARALEEEG